MVRTLLSWDCVGAGPVWHVGPDGDAAAAGAVAEDGGEPARPPGALPFPWHADAVRPTASASTSEEIRLPEKPINAPLLHLSKRWRR
ncbi:hypothetical protein GCM10010430_70320 [Kitasatospora cystarginea]|uniref:Uncharacterized protein n=1 Tax=Kitasatospora cystarginea TaxID=58350 RepID=A0ABP5RVM2_9ACTN